MRILIGSPPITGPGHPQLLQNRQAQWFTKKTRIFPVLMGYLATILHRNGHTVRWVDGGDEWRYILSIRVFLPDIIIWEGKTPFIKKIWALTWKVKEIHPCKIILVGDHVSALPHETLERGNVDYILKGGDYELVSEVVEMLSEGLSPPALYTPPPSTLTALPLLNRELIQWKDYSIHNGNFLRTPGTYTMFARDCWWGKCTFCSWTNLFPAYRTMTVDQAMAELESCAMLGIKEVFDDSGTFPRGRWLHDFCKELRKFNRGGSWRNSRISFGCNMRAGAISADEWGMLGEAGFRLILIGFESANNDTLRFINKGTCVGDVLDAVRGVRSAGMHAHVTCMVGYPNEGCAEAEKTISFAKQLFREGCFSLQATRIVPYPGTKLFEWAKENGCLIHGDDWEKYDMRSEVLKCGVSDVGKVIRRLYGSWLTPGGVMQQLKVSTWDEVKYKVRGVKYLLGHMKDFK